MASMPAKDTLLKNTKEKKPKKTLFTSSSTSVQNTKQNLKSSTHYFFIALLLLLLRSLFIMPSSSTASRGVATAFVAPPLPSTLLHHQQHQRPKSSIFPDTKETERNKPLNMEVINFDVLDTLLKQTTVIPTDQSRNFIPDLIQTKSLRTTLNLPTLARTGLFGYSPQTTISTSHIHAPSPLVLEKPQIIGHRETIHHELENTRNGFIRAVDEMGCDGIELDVFLLKCGTLAVFHGGGSDENPGDLTEYCVLEKTNEKNSILDYTYEEAQQFRFNPNFQEFACGSERSISKDAYIPTLKDVLLDMKVRNKIVKIELKGPGTAKPVLELVEELDMVSQCHYSSFDHSRIHTIRKLRPKRLPNGSHVYKTGALFNDVPPNFVNIAKQVDASEIHLRYDTCTPERIAQIHKAGMDSMSWSRGPIGMREDTTTVYHDVGYEDMSFHYTMLQTGVKQLCVNKPDVLSNLLKNMEYNLKA